jgi:cytochrome d ubiquinol oxidase subunit I
VWISLSVLTLLYGVLAVIELGLITHFVRRGVTTGDATPTPAGADPDRGGDTGHTDADREDDVLSFAY